MGLIKDAAITVFILSLSCLRDRRFAERTGENAAASTGAHGKRGRARVRAGQCAEAPPSLRFSVHFNQAQHLSPCLKLEPLIIMILIN